MNERQSLYEKAMQEVSEQTVQYKYEELSKALSELKQAICDDLGITRLTDWLVKKLNKQ